MFNTIRLRNIVSKECYCKKIFSRSSSESLKNKSWILWWLNKLFNELFILFALKTKYKEESLGLLAFLLILIQQFRFIIGDAETDNGVETAESRVTSFDLLWPWIVISYESCRNDRFEFLMTSFDLSSMTLDDLCSVSSSKENSVTELDGSLRISSFLSFHHKLT